MKDYGILAQNTLPGELDAHLENLSLKGYSIEPGVLSEAQCIAFSEGLDSVYDSQVAETGEDQLARINEIDLARMPFMYDSRFFDLFMHPLVLNLAERVLGTHFTLHLQNGVINRPSKEHHQTSWHRDLPYQEWVCTKSLGFNAFYCISEFNSENGATFVLPYSHHFPRFPSAEYVSENELQLCAPRGAVVFFDSMVYHRAGLNHTDRIRYAINNMFVVPILKQQVDISGNFVGAELGPKEAAVLGLNFEVPKDVADYRARKLNKLPSQ